MPKVNGVPKVKFNLDRATEQALIFAFYHYGNGQRVKCSTGEKIYSEYWNTKTQRLDLNRKHPEHSEINRRLNELENIIVQIFKDFNNGAISTDDFKNEIMYRYFKKPRPSDNQKAIPTLFEFIEKFIEEKKVQPRGTWKILQTVFNLMKQYSDERNGAMNYDSIDFTFSHDFKAWLFAAPREASTNYAAKVFSVVRQFMREAQRRNYHQKTDYQGFSIKQVKVSQLALTFDELETLYNLDLSDNQRLERVRDLFLVGAYTGLRFSDFTRIKPQHIEVIEGTKIINITTQKTGDMVSIPLLDIPLTILNKYNFSIPSISNQKMNEYLKELGQLAGLDDKVLVTGSKAGKRTDTYLEKWEKLSSHVARRSFATNFYRDGTPANVIMKITGHATERQFMQYIKLEAKQNAIHFAKLQKPKAVLKVVE